MSFIGSSVLKLALPKVVSFDAFGTIYTPKIPVSEQYFNIAKNYIDDLHEVKESSVVDAIMEMRTRYPNYGKVSNMTQEQWWSEVIKSIFAGSTYDQRMIKEIFDHFVDKEAYRLYEDVRPLLLKLKELEVKTIICSNSDNRLRQIIHSLELGEFFEDQDMYLSYDLDCSKPSLQFFNKVLDDLSRKMHLDRTLLVTTDLWWHCGDEYKKDFQFAVNNGIRGIFLNRDPQISIPEIKNPHIAVTDLNAILVSISDIDG